MAFDFDNSIETISSGQLVHDMVNEDIERLITEDVEILNGQYQLLVMEKKNGYYSYNEYEKNDPFEFTEHKIHPDYKAVHFYTRNIKSHGIGAWDTLGFWSVNKSHVPKQLYLDGAAFCSYDFFIDILGFDAPVDCYGFSIVESNQLLFNFQHIENYMNVVKCFDSVDRNNKEFRPNAWATFRMNRIIPAMNNVQQYTKFLKFCSTYEDNDLYAVKFNLSFAMTIAFNIMKENNRTIEELNELSEKLKAIMQEKECPFLSAKDLSMILHSPIMEYNKNCISMENNLENENEYVNQSLYKNT